MSDLTNQEKLEEIYRVSLENNHLLHRMQARTRITAIFQLIYWLAILGALGGAYLYIRPVFDAIQNNNTKAEGVIQQFEMLRSQFPETKAIQGFFNQLKGAATDTDANASQ
jgi:hypothetical protein